MTTTPIQVTAFEIHKAIALDGVGLDPIRVILHDIKPGEGRLIIECYGDSWSTYWGGMGQYRIMQFVCEADVDYVTSRMLNSDGTQAQKAMQEKYLRRIVHAVKEALRERHIEEIKQCKESKGLEVFLRNAIDSCNEQADSFKTANYLSAEHGSRAMATAYGIALDYILVEKQSGVECVNQSAQQQQLPGKAGFYWWRKTQADEWCMVQIVDFGGGMLCAYDIEFQKWSGLSMEVWKKHDPSGYWIAIGKPAFHENGKNFGGS